MCVPVMLVISANDSARRYSRQLLTNIVAFAENVVLEYPLFMLSISIRSFCLFCVGV